MSVLLIPNPTKDTGLAVTRQAAAVLAEQGIPVLMPQAFTAADGLDGVRFLPEEQAYRAAEQVVTIGGDGTLLRAGLDENGVPSVLTHLTKLTCESVMKTYRVTQQQAERYMRDMWLGSHGIAALIVTNSCPYTDEQISRIFTGFSLSVYKSIKEIPGFAENDYDRDAEFRKLVEK